MLTGTELALAGLAAAAAGLTNALAGGGTLISFPALVALGVPEVVANITNTVALCPGYVGGALAQRKDLAGQKKRLMMLVPAGIVGGLIGGILLLYVSEQVFHILVPFLILLAAALLAVQDRVRDWIRRADRARWHGGQGVPECGPPGRTRRNLWRVFRAGALGDLSRRARPFPR